MHIERRETQKMDNSAGVSEIIGAVLLISLVVVSIGIVAALLFSQTAPPTKIPNMNFMTGVSPDNTTLYLYHSGGDPLNVGEFNVLVDGVAKSYSVSGGSSQWSLGTNLIVPIATVPATTVPKNVQIVYNGGSTTGTATTYTSTTNGTVLVRQGSNVNTTVNVSADQAPYLDCSAVANPTCLANIPSNTINTMYMTNTTQKLIRFMQNNQAYSGANGPGPITGAAGSAYHFNFTVTNENSTIIAGTANQDTCAAGTTYYLHNGDKVGIILVGYPNSFYIYGMGSQIWYMNVGTHSRVVIQISNQTTTITLPANANLNANSGTNCLCNAYIESYTSLDSTIDIVTQTTNVITYLKVNNTQYINGVNTSTITVNNIKPIYNGLINVEFGGTTEPVYFVGWADSISGIGTGPLGL